MPHCGILFCGKFRLGPAMSSLGECSKGHGGARYAKQLVEKGANPAQVDQALEGIAQRSCLACVIPVGWVKTAEGHLYARMPDG
jgi:hypothetical protein